MKKKLLQKRLRAFDELSSGKRKPKTALQRHFVDVCNGKFEPHTEDEKAYLAYLKACKAATAKRVFIDEKFESSDDLISLGDYHPWGWHKQNGGTRENYDKHSRLILDLKYRRQQAIKHFEKILDGIVAPDVTLSYVPSHDMKKTTSGVWQLVELLCSRQGRVNATDCIVRTETIPKLSKGGYRSIERHLSSLNVGNVKKISEHAILVIDDVTTSGNSLEACKRLFIEAGAAKVRILALGKTI